MHRARATSLGMVLLVTGMMIITIILMWPTAQFELWRWILLIVSVLLFAGGNLLYAYGTESLVDVPAQNKFRHIKFVIYLCTGIILTIAGLRYADMPGPIGIREVVVTAIGLALIISSSVKLGQERVSRKLQELADRVSQY